jgi:hypothetical protein
MNEFKELCLEHLGKDPSDITEEERYWIKNTFFVELYGYEY